jgi:hypothetical protein
MDCHNTNTSPTPQDILREAFSIRPVRDEDVEPLVSIGKGSFGTIYSQNGTSSVFKMRTGIDQHAYPLALWDELLCLNDIHKAIQAHLRIGLNIHIPKPFNFIRAQDNDFWDINAHRFPAYQQPCDLLEAERIPPAPAQVRNALIDLFCPEKLRSAARESVENKDCLIRLYLGREKHSDGYHFGFKLRNFPLHLNQMRDLDLDTKYFARAMAEALAVIHWVARYDAKDIEFVAGGRPRVEMQDLPCREEMRSLPPRSQIFPHRPGFDFGERVLHLWCLDFNQCKKITLDDRGVAQCVDAFIENDPYYPRPRRGQTDLWEAFACRYKEVSREVLERSTRFELSNYRDNHLIIDRKLPEKFLAGVERHYATLVLKQADLHL